MKYIKLFENETDFSADEITVKSVGEHYLGYIKDVNRVEYERVNTINNNGYEYVDLGLPSGTLWATKNIGATSLEDPGLYFAWAETQGYADESGDKKFDLDHYKWDEDFYGSGFKYLHKNVIDLDYDAVIYNMGGDWHMPTRAQILELIENCTFITDAPNNVLTGFDITGPNGNKMYIPTSGYYNGKETVNDIVGYAYFWSSDKFTWNDGYILRIVRSGDGMAASVVDVYNRQFYLGIPMRGVIG